MRIERETVVPAPPAAAWDAIVDPSLLEAWLGGDARLDVDLEVVPGAVGTVAEAEGPVRRVRVDRVDPPRHLRFTWWPDDGSGPLTQVDLYLQEVDGGTRVRVFETYISPAPHRRLGFQLRARSFAGV